MAPPFDKCCIVGPILNEGGLDELRQKLRRELRSFFNRRPVPLNSDPDKVDRYLLNKLAHDVQQQTRLPGAPMERTSVHIGWLSGRSPAQWMQNAEDEWDSKRARASDVPSNPFARSSWSILGTLSLMAGSCEIPRLHKSLGPHRMVTQRHTQRLVKWLEEANWIHRQQNHIPFAEGQVFKLRDAWIGFARLPWPCGHFGYLCPHGGETTQRRLGKRRLKMFSSRTLRRSTKLSRTPLNA